MVEGMKVCPVTKKRNHKIFQAAERILVGGVDSPARAFGYVGCSPILIRKGKGSVVYDYSGEKYIDYVLSFGVHILGHAHPEITTRIKKAVDLGLGFGTTHSLEIELAERIKKAIPLLNKIRFVNSGTEAVMGVLRLARGATGRNKIVKFENSYHGHADYLLAKAGSGLATFGLPISKGIPKDFFRHTLVVSYANKNSLEDIFNRYGSDIAAVIVEPVGGNHGVVLPDIPFLQKLRSITKKFGALLIFDEVITGFRFHFGSAADYFGIKPDLICLGKIIGGGLPIGAYGGNERIMKHLSPLGAVYQASTFSGNPVVMSAGLATLEALESLKKDYKRTNRITSYLSEALKHEAQLNGIEVTLRYFGPMFSLHFKKKKHFQIFYKFLLKKGVFFAPSEYESNFVSFAHSDDDIAKTIAAAREAFGYIAKRELR